MWMNPSLPLIYQGEIVTSSWMLQNPVQGYELITGPLDGASPSNEQRESPLRFHERIKELEKELKLSKLNSVRKALGY